MAQYPSMNERYGRSLWANEFLLRNTVIQKMANGWKTDGSFCIPETFYNAERIENGPTSTQRSIGDTVTNLATQTVQAPLQVAVGTLTHDLVDTQVGPAVVPVIVAARGRTLLKIA